MYETLLKFWEKYRISLSLNLIAIGLLTTFSIKYTYDMEMEFKNYIDSNQKILEEHSGRILELEKKNDEIVKRIGTLEIKDNKVSKIEYNKDNTDTLLEEYSYVLNKTDGSRTDLSIEELEYGIEQMNLRNLNPHLLFNIILLESGVKRDYSGINGGHGYSNLNDSIYREMYHTLSLGEYGMNKPIGKMSILVTCEYLYQKVKEFNGDFEKVCFAFNGRGYSYYGILDEYLKTNSKISFKDITKQYIDSTSKEEL